MLDLSISTKQDLTKEKLIAQRAQEQNDNKSQFVTKAKRPDKSKEISDIQNH